MTFAAESSASGPQSGKAPYHSLTLPHLFYLYISEQHQFLMNLANFIEPSWAGIFKPVWSPGIDAKASTPPAYVARRAGTITLFLVGA